MRDFLAYFLAIVFIGLGFASYFFWILAVVFLFWYMAKIDKDKIVAKRLVDEGRVDGSVSKIHIEFENRKQKYATLLLILIIGIPLIVIVPKVFNYLSGVNSSGASEVKSSELQPNLDLFQPEESDQTLARAKSLLPQFSECANGDKITPKKNADIKQMALDNIQGYLSEKNKVLTDDQMNDKYLKAANADPTWHNMLYNIEAKVQGHLSLLKVRCDIAQESKSNNDSKIDVNKSSSKEPVDSPEDIKMYNKLDALRKALHSRKVSAFAQFPSPFKNGVGNFIQENNLVFTQIDGPSCDYPTAEKCNVTMFVTRKEFKKYRSDMPDAFCGAILSYESSKKTMDHWLPTRPLAEALAEGRTQDAINKIDYENDRYCK